MINFMNLLRRTEEEFFPSNVKSVRKKGCRASVSDRGDRGSFYNFEHPAFLNKIIFFFFALDSRMNKRLLCH